MTTIAWDLYTGGRVQYEFQESLRKR